MAELDLLLVNPGGTKTRAYQELSEGYSAIEPPFWAALTAGFIKKRGYNVSILDSNAENITNKESAERIARYDPKIVNIVVYGQHPSASTQLMTSVGNLCKEIKSINPEQKIILSGLHPSSLPERTLDEESCDYVCQGEGFNTLAGLLKGDGLEEIPGLWFRQNGEVRGNPRARNIENLTEELDDVAWDLLQLKEGKYRAHNWQSFGDFQNRDKYASLSTSLGCFGKCSFCSVNQLFGERKMRFWSPEWVANQIEELYSNHGVKNIKIIDEIFIFDQKHYLKIADKLIERGLGDKLNIWAYSRVDTLKEEHLDKLRMAGLKWISFGFESGNEGILKETHKGNFTRKDMVHMSRKVQKADISIISNYMFGFSNDNLETMQQTLDLALEQNCEFANFYSAIAWPGSELYSKSIELGISFPNKWEDYAQHAFGFIPLPTRYLSPQEVLRFRDHAFDTYFKNKDYLNMIEKKFGNETRMHIEGMTKINLKRKVIQ